MSIISSITERYKRLTPRQFVLTGVFLLAFAGTIGGGLASKQSSTAAMARDCSANSIDKANINGGCGATTPSELIADIKSNTPPDLNNIYRHFGLNTGNSGDYDRFVKTARMGTALTNGKIVVDNEVVMEDAWSIGRTKFGYSTNYPIDNHTYYKSMHTSVLNSNIPVMVMFDANGTVEFATLTACGNPVNGKKITSSAECKALNKVAINGKENTYKFNSTVSKTGLAKFVKFEYFMNDGSGDKLFATTTDASTFTKEVTFTKNTTVFVKVTISLPGKQTKVITSDLCKKVIEVKKKEVFYRCKALVTTVRDDANRKFRFTVHTEQSANVTVKSANFTLDSSTTVTGVTDKDENGRFYREYTFTDDKKHTVFATVNFVVDGKTVTTQKVDVCAAEVTPKEKPKECPEKPGSGLPPGHPDCKELPKTGAGSVIGLFAGVSLAGAVGHRIYMSRRAR